MIDGSKPVKSTRSVTIKGDDRTLDETSLARARKLVGLKGYVTNIAADVMPAPEVISKYHDLWHVEQSFRMSKHDLQARPMFHRTREAIEAHPDHLVFAALAVASRIQNQTGLAIANVVKQLRPLRTSTITMTASPRTSRPRFPQLNAKSSTTSASKPLAKWLRS